MLDEPRLYTYVFHGANTTGEAQFTQHCGAATQQFTGDAYDRQLALLGTRVPTDTDPVVQPNENQSTDAPAGDSVSLTVLRCCWESTTTACKRRWCAAADVRNGCAGPRKAPRWAGSCTTLPQSTTM